MALQHLPAPVSQTSPHGLLPDVATASPTRTAAAASRAPSTAHSSKTRAVYASAWRSLEKWTRLRGVPSMPFPPNWWASTAAPSKGIPQFMRE